MPATPTISVVIPTFNRPEATSRAIHSALVQSWKPDEIIVVDDGSTPPFQKTFPSSKDPKVKILTLPENRGASAARQAGIDVAQGDFIAFLDSDDQWLPHKLAAQMELLARTPGLTAVSCGWAEEGDRSKERIPIPCDNAEGFASGCWFAPGSTVILPRSSFAIVGPFDPDLRRLEDLDWFLRFALKGGKLAVAPIIGVRISIGRRGKTQAVDHASSHIMSRIDQTLPRQVRRNLAAYLDLERSVAARNDGRYGAMILNLARSFLRYPRLRLHLRRWWQEREI